MEKFREESSLGESERLQVKELEALQAEILSKLTANTSLEHGAAVPPASQPTFALNSSAFPLGTQDAGWGAPEGRYTSPGRQERSDTVPHAVHNRTGRTAESPGRMNTSDTTHCSLPTQQVWASPRSMGVFTPPHSTVATPNHMGIMSTQTVVTTPTYPPVTPPTLYSVATPTQSVVVPTHHSSHKESAVKVNLVEKHAKHIADLQVYYEGEMKKLREQVSNLEQQAATSEQSWPHWRAVVGTSGGVSRSPAQTRSPSLFGSPAAKTALRFPSSPLKLPGSPGSLAAGDTAAKLQENLEEVQLRAATSDRMVRALHDRLERERERVREVEELRNQMQEELASFRHEAEVARQELHSARSKRLSVEQQLREVLHELELSYAENRHFHEEYALLAEQLRERDRSVKELRERLQMAEEEGQQANRTIQDLEEDVRRLRRHSNRDYSMASHHSFGQEGVSVQALDSTPSHTPPTTTAAQPVSRRKWLETSANGFVYGTPEGSRSGDRKLGSGDRKLKSRDRKQEPMGVNTANEGAPPPSSTRVDATPLSSLSHPSSLHQNWMEATTGNPYTARPSPYLTPGSVGRNTPYLAPGSVGRSAGGRSVNFFNLPDVAESTIAAIKRGSVMSEEGEWRHTHKPMEKESNRDSDPSTGDSHEPSPPLSVEERVKARMETVAQAQKQFDQLQVEKQQLEAVLSRVPVSGRVTLQNRQHQRTMETRLDEVLHEIGLVKLVLRSNNAF